MRVLALTGWLRGATSKMEGANNVAKFEHPPWLTSVSEDAAARSLVFRVA